MQRWMLRCWNDFWEEVAERKRRERAKVFVVFNGDQVERDKFKGFQTITSNPATILRMNARLCEPALDVADKYFFTRGTPVHTGRSAWMEEKLAEDLGAVPDEEAETFSWWFLPIEVGGVEFLIAHRPETSGRRPWTMNAAAARQSSIVLSQYAESGDRPPDVAVYNHVHYLADSGIGTTPRTFFNLSWSLATEFVRTGLGGGTSPRPIGSLVFTCRDGQLVDIYDFQRRPQRKRMWRK
jgi:hypothetical protein